MSSRNHPRVENLRVAIVGAGPSGLTIAHFLKTLGLRSVQFFEAQNDIGGQSVTVDVDGVPVEMGTVYLTDGYILAKDIARSVGCPARVLPPASVLDEAGNVIPHETPSRSLLARYVYLWLRWYLGGQMRWPDRRENAQSFGDWLRGNRLPDLATGFVFTAGLTAQLYGPIDDISAHSGLNWMRPSVLLTGRLGQTAHIPEGFQILWKRLAKELGFPVHRDKQIDAVRPTRDGHRVELLQGGEPIDEPFDHVFLACPLDYLEDHPVEGLAGPSNRLEHPLSRVLKDPPLADTEVYSAAWKGTNWPRDVPSRCYLPAAGKNERGPLLTIRNYDTVDGYAIGQLCSYALRDQPLTASEEDNERRLEANRQRVVEDMRNIVGLEDIEIVRDRLWRYNIRYSIDQLAEGVPLFIEAAQGRQNVWYTGGTLSHWNIDAITDYNQVLAKRFARQIGLPFLTRLRLFRLSDVIRDL